MSIIKTVKTVDDRFARIENAALRDRRLSWKARGLLAYLLSMPDNWRTNIKHLTGQSPGGESVVRTGLKELADAGYLVRNPVKGADGRITHWESSIYESPPSRGVNANDEPQCGFPHVEKPDVENRTVRTTKGKNEPSSSRRKMSTPRPVEEKENVPAAELWFNPYRAYSDHAAQLAYERRVATIGPPAHPARWRRHVSDQWARDHWHDLDAIVNGADEPPGVRDLVEFIESGVYPAARRPVVVGCAECGYSGWHEPEDGENDVVRCSVTA